MVQSSSKKLSSGDKEIAFVLTISKKVMKWGAELEVSNFKFFKSKQKEVGDTNIFWFLLNNVKLLLKNTIKISN